MRDYTKFRKKQIGKNLIPEQYDGYDYKYHLIQDSRNVTGLLDTNPVFEGVVVDVIDIVNPESDDKTDFVVVATINLLDEGLIEESDYTKYKNSPVYTLLDHFIPETNNVKKPQIGRRVYLYYSDSNNRLGGIYAGEKYDFSLTDLIVDEAISIFQNAKEALLGNNNKTRATIGQCNISPSGQINFSNCTEQEQGPGEYEVLLGNEQTKVKMVLLDFNSKKNVLIAEIAYNSLQKMFEDASSQGINLRINQGFRSLSKQQCYYNNYKACLQEWIARGRTGPRPSAVANPERAARSKKSHLQGVAADFNTGVERNQYALQDIFDGASVDKAAALEETKRRLDAGKINSTKEWKWLIENSEKYGWVWSGIKFREPWHFHFSETLAKRNNIS